MEEIAVAVDAHLEGIRPGLNLARDLDLSCVRLASDCLSVVNALKEANLGRYSHIIQEIKIGAEEIGVITFVHENRSSNKEPHDLARLVSSLPVGRHIWLVNPPVGVCIPNNLVN